MTEFAGRRRSSADVESERRIAGQKAISVMDSVTIEYLEASDRATDALVALGVLLMGQGRDDRQVAALLAGTAASVAVDLAKGRSS